MVMPSHIDDASQRVFSAQDREHAIRRDLGRCRLCGDTSQRFRIRYFQSNVSNNNDACLICVNCDEAMKSSPSCILIPIDEIRASETIYRQLHKVPLTLDTKSTLIAEQGGRVRVMSPRKQNHPGGIVSEKQESDRRQLRQLSNDYDDQIERDHRELAVVKARRYADAEQERWQLTFSLASEVTVSRPDGTVVTILPSYTVKQLAAIIREREPISSKTRLKIFKRDRGLCRYCLGTSDEYEIDHVTPVAAGGHSLITNLVLACRDCNRRKGASTDTVKWHPRPLAEINKIACPGWDRRVNRNPPATSRRGR